MSTAYASLHPQETPDIEDDWKSSVSDLSDDTEVLEKAILETEEDGASETANTKKRSRSFGGQVFLRVTCAFLHLGMVLMHVTLVGI